MGSPRLQRRAALSTSLLVTALLAVASPARADVGETIIQRCTHGQSLRGFSQRDYGRALKELSADAEEYTDCAALIRQAQLAAARGGGAGASGGAGEAPLTPIAVTPSEQRAIARAAKTGGAPLAVGTDVVHPGVVHADVASAFSSLPTPVLAIVALVLAAALAFGANLLRNRVRARRPG